MSGGLGLGASRGDGTEPLHDEIEFRGLPVCHPTEDERLAHEVENLIDARIIFICALFITWALPSRRCTELHEVFAVTVELRFSFLLLIILFHSFVFLLGLL